MRLHPSSIVRLTLVVALLCTPAAAAQSPPLTPAQVEQMLEPLRPVAEHADLAGLAGRWTQEVTYSMGGPPMKASGTVVNRMILGGRFLVSEGTSNNPSGIGDSAVEFLSIYGFDRRTQEFTIVTYDTMGTYYVTASGRKTATGLIRMAGETLEHDARTTGTRRYEMTLHVIDSNQYVTEIIFKDPGSPDRTVVSVTHRRQR